MPRPASRLLAAIGAVLVLGIAATLFLGMYSRRDDSHGFEERVGAVLAAAGDSAALDRMALSADARTWLLQTAAHNPALLARLRQGLAAGPRARNHGKLAVSFGADGFRMCSSYPLTVIFDGNRASDPIDAVIAACPP